MIRLYIGKSAAGKDFHLKEDIKNGLIPIVSYATRPMREGEVNGVDYNFISKHEFKKLIKLHEEFLHSASDPLTEWRSYDTLYKNKEDTWYYGTPRVDPSKDYVGVVEISGAHAFINTYNKDNLEIIYLDVPDEIRKQRAMNRSSFDKTEWDRRLETDTKDFSDEAIANLITHLGKPIIIETYTPDCELEDEQNDISLE